MAAFYAEVMEALRSLDIVIDIWTMPQEVPDPIPFDRDVQHAAYDPEYAQRWWRVLVQIDRVSQVFRSRFIGKVSPVHLFWSSFDLALTRFSGRRAPEHPGGGPLPLRITRDAYSHEECSCGWWPGGGNIIDGTRFRNLQGLPPSLYLVIITHLVLTRHTEVSASKV